MVLYFIKSEKIDRKLIGAYTLFAFLYAIFFGMSASSRAVLLLLPLSLFFLVLLYKQLTNVLLNKILTHQRNVVTLVIMCFATMHIAVFVYKAVTKIVDRRVVNATYREIEQTLLKHGATSADQVFTNDFNLFFYDLKPYYPRKNGGWPKIGTWGWNEHYPDIEVKSIELFMVDCRKNGIDFIVLNAQVEHLSSPLADVYSGTSTHDDLVLIRDLLGNKVFSVL